MELEEEIREERKKEKQKEQKVLIYLFLGLFVTIGVIYLYSQGILSDLITWERGEEETEVQQQEEPREEPKRQEKRAKVERQEEKAERTEPREEPKQEEKAKKTETSSDTLLSSGVPTLALIAPNGASHDYLKKLCQTMRAQHTRKTRFTIAIYADTPIGRQIANGTLKNPSPAVIKLNRLLLYAFDPDKGEQYTFPPF